MRHAKIDENGACHAKKSRGLLREATEVKYEFIVAHPESPDTKWAAILEVSRSGYYEWKKSREERKQRIYQSDDIIRKIFMESKGTYGAERICGELRKQGQTASCQRIRKRMEMMGLNSIHMRRKQRGEGYANLVKDLEITRPF